VSGISGINTNNYNPLASLTAQNNSQSGTKSSNTASSAITSLESILSSVSSIQNSEEISLLQNSLGLSQSGSLESLTASLTNLQLLDNSNILQTDPSLAGQILGASGTTSSLESFSSSMANLLTNVQTVNGASTQQNSPATQYVSQSQTPSDNGTGTIVNTIA